MNRDRWRVVFTTVAGRQWLDFTSETNALAEYRSARRGMWGYATRLLRERGDQFVQVAP